MAYKDEIKEGILREYSTARIINRNIFQLEKGKILFHKLMKYYNTSPYTKRNGEIIDDLNIAEDVVIENIEALIEGNNKIDIIVQKSVIKETL